MLPIIRVGLLLLILVNIWGAYVALHGLPAAILANDNPTQNTDVFFWSVVSAIVWSVVLVYLLKIKSKPATYESKQKS